MNFKLSRSGRSETETSLFYKARSKRSGGLYDENPGRFGIPKENIPANLCHIRQSVIYMGDQKVAASNVLIGLDRVVRRHGRLANNCPTSMRVERPMLVLSRKLGEKILIGDNIVLTVVKVDRNQIRLGIEAPTEIAVYREEIAPGRNKIGEVIAGSTR